MNIDNIEAKEEALNLSKDILADIELSRLQLSNIALKTSRLARVINDLDYEKVFEYEAGGYPSTSSGVPSNIWKLGKLAGRVSKNANGEESMNTKSLSSMEVLIDSNKIALEQAADRDVAITSSNPNQYVWSPATNEKERNQRIYNINTISNQLSDRKSFIYSYVKKVYYELKFSLLTESIWLKIKSRIDSYISEIIPEETQKLAAIYDSLNDDNPEKWATALTTCRRMLKAIADKLYPPTEIILKKGKREIKLGEEQYINRLICYIEDNSSHQTLDKITNSNLDYIGTRLDNIINEACKGTHANVDKEEAERCFMHVYMIIGDILEIERQAQKNNKE